MPSARFQPAFTSGVLGPALWGRVDLQKYDSALRQGKNVIVHSHGGISNRPGTKYVCEVMDHDKRHRLVPFTREADDTAILIFGENKMGVVKNGAQVKSGASPYVSATPYNASQAWDMDFVQSIDVMFTAQPAYPPQKLSRFSDTDWQFTTLPINPAVPSPTITSLASHGGAKPALEGEDYSYQVTAVVNGVEGFPSPVQTLTSVQPLREAGAYNHIFFDPVAGAEEYRIYKVRNGVGGFIGYAKSSPFKDDNIDADMTVTPPVSSTYFNGPGKYPSVVSMFQQRLVLAASNSEPETIWMSRAGDYFNFTRSRIISATDRAEFNISGEELNRIRGLLQLRELLVFTSSGEWSVTGPDGGFSALNPIVTRYGYVGSGKVKPLVSDDTALFVDRTGQRVRDLRYAYESDGYSGNDLTIFASHFFMGRRIVSWAMAKNPFSLIWVVLDNGKLLSLTYNREHQVWGWTEHEMSGRVESVACVPEGGSDATYFIVVRNIGGQVRRYVERLDDRDFTTAEDAYFVDCGITYDDAATATISGLGHLEGREVTALADGDVVAGLTVTGGSVTLPRPASKVHVGLPFSAMFENLPPAIQFDDVGASRGRPHSISAVRLQMERTRGIKIATQDGRTNEIVQTGYDLSKPIPLWTGMHALTMPRDWNPDGTVIVKQDYPLPMTILALSVELSVGRN